MSAEENGTIDLPEVDRQIIRILQADGRRPVVRIAEDVGLDVKTVRRRMADLRGAGIIDVTTVTDPALLGYRAMALCGLTIDVAVSPTVIADALAEIDAVDYVVVAAGRFDILVEVLGRDSEELDHTIEDEIRSLGGVRACETFPYLRLHLQEQRWEATRGNAERDGRMQGGRPLDHTDRAIIKALNEDGRAPLRQIADELRVSESQVRQRLSQLTESGAMRIMAITNPFNLGFRGLAWFAVRVGDGVGAAAVAERLAEVPSIAYLAVCAGRFDVLAEAVCVDHQDLLRVLDEEVRPLPGVARVESWVFIRGHYKRLRPLL